MIEQLQQSVKEQARELDKILPDWRSRLSGKIAMTQFYCSIYQRYSCGCILAQLDASLDDEGQGTYDHAGIRWPSLDIESPAFCPDHAEGRNKYRWGAMVETLWRAEINHES